MKRALLFFLVFIAVITVVYAIVVGFNYSGFKTLFENEEGMAEGSQYVENTYSLKALSEFVGEHPEFVSIASYNIENPDSGIYYQSETPRTLGSLSNIFLLIEYERQVSEGILDPEELIEISEIEKFSLPEISKNYHQGLLERLGEDKAALDDIVAAMISSNDIAAADFLWFKLGEDNIRALFNTLEVNQSLLSVPFVGMYININPSLSDTSELANLSFESFANKSIATAKRFNDNQDFRDEVYQQFEDDRLSLTFMQERDALAYFPQATSQQMTYIMYHLVNGLIISPEVSEKVMHKLRWPLSSEPIDRSFEDYGAIYDSRMGMLSGIDFGTSIYDGHTSVQAVFFDQLPVAFWIHLSANHMQEDYQQRLIWDPALYETTQNVISAHE